MSLKKLDAALRRDLDALAAEGRAKAPERVLDGYQPAVGGRGPRWRVRGREGHFLRMNSNSYLSLGHHPRVLEKADAASAKFGAGPGAVRFIDGTFSDHVALEDRIARFVDKPAAKIFNSAYTSNLGLALAIQNESTYWIGDQFNHNCIIRAMRIANVPRGQKAIYRHNDLDELKQCLDAVPAAMKRVIVITDGIFSIRGDNAPLAEIHALIEPYRDRFEEGLVTVVDDSHGVGAYGETGRGTEEYCGTKADIVVGTFGKAFGVNGGFVAASEAVVETIRQKADTYIFTNSLSSADCAAACAAVDVADSEEGRERLRHLKERIAQFREGIGALGLESIEGPHPVVPVLVRDTTRCRAIVEGLFEDGILVTGLTVPVVPVGEETLRFQLNAAHTEADVEEACRALGRRMG